MVKVGGIDVATFDKSISELERFVPVPCQNGAGAFFGFVYSWPKLVLRYPIAIKERRDFPKVLKPRFFMSRAVEKLFRCFPSGVVQNLVLDGKMIDRRGTGSTVPVFLLSIEHPDDHHRQAERMQHDGVPRLVTANPAWRFFGRCYFGFGRQSRKPCSERMVS